MKEICLTSQDYRTLLKGIYTFIIESYTEYEQSIQYSTNSILTLNLYNISLDILSTLGIPRMISLNEYKSLSKRLDTMNFDTQELSANTVERLVYNLSKLENTLDILTDITIASNSDTRLETIERYRNQLDTSRNLLEMLGLKR